MRWGQLGRLPSGLTGQGLRFAIVGSLASVVQLALYAFLSGSVGAQLANILAWLVSTLLGNAAHHRYTFQVTGTSTESDHLVGLLTSLAGLGISSLVLEILGEPSGLAGTIALVAVNSAVGVLRFLTLHQWFGRSAVLPPVAVITPVAITRPAAIIRPVAVTPPAAHTPPVAVTPPAAVAFASADR